MRKGDGFIRRFFVETSGESLDQRHYRLAVLVAALGYFVDIYDLLLFSIVRVQSLKSLGVAEELLLEKGVLLINTQMAGLLLGGILWGILGDKKGRLSVLFGSIVLYSLANIANAFVQTVEQYAVLRFVAGLGLAGELGAGITLVSELMPKEKRGWGTTIVASIGILGAVLAAFVGDIFDWRVAYVIGGAMGLALLALRVGVRESLMFESLKSSDVSKGNFLSLFTSAKRFKRYVCVILTGVPIWYTVGVLVTFAPEIGRAFGMAVVPSAGQAVMFNYLGLAAGDFLSGLVSQWLGSRKKTLLIFLTALGAAIVGYFLFAGRSLFAFYTMCVLLGLASGYWAMFVTVASEQFGTNIRSTATTTVPNFVRGAVIPVTMLFQFLKTSQGIPLAAGLTGALTLTIAFLAVGGLEETFGKDLDYVE